MATPAGLLLAAGAGRRLGRAKALVEWDGRPLVEHGVAALAEGGCAPVVCVLGAERERVRAAADLAPAEVVEHPGWADGLASSLGAGLDALEGRCPAAIVALVDQPLVGAAAVARVAAAWRQGRAPAIVATYDGQPRHPVALDARLWPELRTALAGDVGAGPWLRQRPELVAHVACDDVAAPDDVDTPDDLARLSRRPAGSSPAPGRCRRWPGS